MWMSGCHEQLSWIYTSNIKSCIFVRESTCPCYYYRNKYLKAFPLYINVTKKHLWVEMEGMLQQSLCGCNRVEQTALTASYMRLLSNETPPPWMRDVIKNNEKTMKPIVEDRGRKSFMFWLQDKQNQRLMCSHYWKFSPKTSDSLLWKSFINLALCNIFARRPQNFISQGTITVTHVLRGTLCFSSWHCFSVHWRERSSQISNCFTIIFCVWSRYVADICISCGLRLNMKTLCASPADLTIPLLPLKHDSDV